MEGAEQERAADGGERGRQAERMCAHCLFAIQRLAAPDDAMKSSLMERMRARLHDSALVKPKDVTVRPCLK